MRILDRLMKYIDKANDEQWPVQHELAENSTASI